MRDKKNQLIRSYDEVVVNNDFQATVMAFKPPNLVTVYDQDGNAYDIEPKLLEIEEREHTMKVEGLINKGRLEALRLAGYDFLCAVVNEEEAIKAREQGYDVPAFDDGSDEFAFVSIITDHDVESVFPANALVKECAPKELARLAVNTDEEVASAAAALLKKGTKPDISRLFGTKRYAYHIVDASRAEDGGYIPVISFQDEPGYYPMGGKGEYSIAWNWSKDLDTAQELAKKYNEKIGVDANEAQEIIDSSIAASMRRK